MIELPVIDLKHYKLTGDPAECHKAAESLHKYGVLCLRDEVPCHEPLAAYVCVLPNSNTMVLLRMCI